jgi:hypothetical protein
MNLERLPEESYCKLQVMSEDEANRMIYEARLKAQRDEYSRTQGAFRKGRQEGAEERKRLEQENERLRREINELKEKQRTV